MNNSLTKSKYRLFDDENKFVKILNPLSKDLAVMKKHDFWLLENSNTIL